MTNQKLESILKFFIGVLSVLLLIQFANRYRVMWDFTEEQKYTLHPASRDVLEDLQETINVEVYLDGDLPSNFRRFRNSVEQNLSQFTIYAGQNVQYKFIDPGLAESAKARNQFYRNLIDKGLQPSNINYTKDGEKTEKLVFPGAILSYRGKEMAVNLLKGSRATSPEEMLNQSIEGLEYELVNAIHEIQKSTRRRVGYVIGHGEPDSLHLAGFTNAILDKYDLFKIDLPGRTRALAGYDVIIVGKPARSFSQYEKYLLDQYVMNGGHLIFFIDALEVDITKVEGDGTVAFPYELNLDDLLFRYGIRINKNYIADINCGTTPIVTGDIGDKPRVEFLPWPYYPVITNYSDHPLVRNLDATWLRGAATLDTVKAEGITKTPLFSSSAYTKIFNPPVMVSYNDLKEKLKPEAFASGPKTLAYLLEGKFTSAFKNRVLPKGRGQSENFKESASSPAKIIVVSDGDFITNELDIESEGPLPMGVDAYSRTTYANESFLINALDYMVDDSKLMLARNREIKIRPLDRAKVKKSGYVYKWVNMVLPVAMIILFGLIKAGLRKRKYARS